MKKRILEQLEAGVEFLGKVLGPDYEITLYDMERKDRPLIAIANGRISGRTIGTPLPELVAAFFAEGNSGREPYIANTVARIGDSEKTVRSSAFPVRDASGRIFALIGINYDDTRVLQSFTDLLELVHPHEYVEQEYPHRVIQATRRATGAAIPSVPGEDEVYYNDVNGMIGEIFRMETAGNPVPPDRLTQQERQALIARLKAKGLFRLKGAVRFTAEQLDISQASVYRYLNKM
ncbi:MAG: PAS domain-containing protein [Firmicutes bacterium]|nr:PAS domain-containing protein [Bacillota bacterium]